MSKNFDIITIHIFVGPEIKSNDMVFSRCKHWNYPEKMGIKASIVLVFHNEGFSTLMRNVHTIIKRSPPEMLEEIVLVDDFSDKGNIFLDNIILFIFILFCAV